MAETLPVKKKGCGPDLLPAPQIITAPALVLFALAAIVHGFIHGLTISQYKDPKSIGMVMVLIIVYKFVVAFAVGVAFLSTGRLFCDPITLIFGLLFILSTPGGILLGVEIDLEKEGLITHMAWIATQAVIIGIFLYIACSSLISNEFQSSAYTKAIGTAKFVMVLLGIILVVAIFTLGG